MDRTFLVCIDKDKSALIVATYAVFGDDGKVTFFKVQEKEPFHSIEASFKEWSYFVVQGDKKPFLIKTNCVD